MRDGLQKDFCGGSFGGVAISPRRSVSMNHCSIIYGVAQHYEPLPKLFKNLRSGLTPKLGDHKAITGGMPSHGWVSASPYSLADDPWHPSDAFIPGYPIADTVELWFFTEGDIPMLKTFIARHMRPEQRLELKAIRPTAEDFYAFSWKILDALLSSWYMMHSREDSQTLILSLNVPPKLWDERQTDKETAPKAEDEENPWLHALFPLTMALGEELWLGYCGEQRGEYSFFAPF